MLRRSTMASYPSGSSSSATLAAASTSDDPYAPFYYWDASANNWAFDYNAYYATYGYPADYYTGGADASSSTAPTSDAAYAYPSAGDNPYYYDYQKQAASASASGSQAMAATSQGSEPIHDPFAPPASTSTTTPSESRYDASGRLIPGKLRKGETRPTVLRRAAGKLWEDQTLLDWDPTHKRLFVGDLGNDVTDELLTSAFEKYPSFSKARVVRNKDGKSKGYGFVAFADPTDFLSAWKQMNRKYIGSRPCTLKKAADVVHPVHIGARKDRLLAITAKHDRATAKSKMGGPVGKSLPSFARSSLPK